MCNDALCVQCTRAIMHICRHAQWNPCKGALSSCVHMTGVARVQGCTLFEVQHTPTDPVLFISRDSQVRVGKSAAVHIIICAHDHHCTCALLHTLLVQQPDRR